MGFFFLNQETARESFSGLVGWKSGLKTSLKIVKKILGFNPMIEKKKI